jgi:hypothetical protein
LPPHFEAWPSGNWLLAITDWLAVLSVVAGYSGTV